MNVFIKNSLIFKLITIVFIFFLFLLESTIILDPDFGWHIRTGEYIFHHGIPKTDPFSYTMPGYPLVIHDWLSDVLLAKGYEIFDGVSLGFITAILAILTLFLQISNTRKQFFILPFLLVGICFSFFTSIRPQMFTWFFFSLLLSILSHQKRLQKWQFFIPLLFIVWANLHAGFAIGICLILLFLLVDSYQQKKLNIKMLLVFFLSFLATFVNPYGVRIWKEVIMTMFSSNLHGLIQEWRPGIFVPHLLIWISVAFSLIWLVRYWKNYTLFIRLAYILLLLAGASSIRHMALFLLVAFFVTNTGLSLFLAEVVKQKGALVRLHTAYACFFIIMLIACLIQLRSDFQKTMEFTENAYYPKNAIDFLRTHSPQGEIFSMYGWGGYLDWKLPEKKVFIDGRMPVWHWQPPNSEESVDALVAYEDIMEYKIPIEQAVEKYHITAVLLPTAKKSSKQSLADTFNILLMNMINTHNKPAKYPDLLTQLKSLGWKKVYEDTVATIYEAPSYQFLTRG